METRYNVIWFDDEHASPEIQYIKKSAKQNGIALNGYANAEDGLNQLNEKIEEFDAVLLDALFFRNESSTDNTNQNALHKVIRSLAVLSNRKKIPFFILSGQPDILQEKDELAELHEVDQIYDKIGLDETSALWMDMIKAIESQEDHQLKATHARAFSFFDNLDNKALLERRLLDLLKAIQNPASPSNNGEILNAVRKIVEVLLSECIKAGIIPEEFMRSYSTAVDPDNDSIHFNEAIGFLAGEVKRDYHLKKPILNRLMQYHLESLRHFTQSGSHRGEIDSLINSTGTSYSYISIVYQLLELLAFFNSFLRDNTDTADNKDKWVYLLDSSNAKTYQGTVIFTKLDSGKGFGFVRPFGIDEMDKESNLFLTEDIIQGNSLKKGDVIKCRAVAVPNKNKRVIEIVEKLD